VVSLASGGVYGFGKNDYGQLGLEGAEARLVPVRLKIFSVVIVQLACGYYHSMALSNAGNLYSFGRNDYGQLGLGHRLSPQGPALVADLREKHIVEVACGCYHTIALSKEGKVYPFGRNNNGQLGTGNLGDACRPAFIEQLSNRFICQV
ncbi:unnamed protein product, partial [Discosporangium mesarthrocarpum]